MTTLSVRRLFDPSYRGLDRLGADHAPPACDRVWPLSDGGWLARLRDSTGDTDTYWGVVKPAGRLPKSLRRLHEAGRCVWLLELEALAWRLEDDPAVGSVGEGTLRPYSSRADLSKFNGLRGRILGYKPLRRAVSRFDDPSGVPRCYAKYLRHGFAARVAERHSLLQSWSSVNGGFGVARLTDLRLDPDILVWQPVSGAPLKQALFAPHYEPAPTMIDRVGRVIASLHLCPSRMVPRHDRQKELQTVASWLSVGKQLMEDPGALESAFSTLVEFEKGLATDVGVVSHRDLHDGQLLISDEIATILDVDTLALAEPELDLGNLLAHLDWNGLIRGEPRWRELADPFVAGYCEVVARSIDWDRLDWYRAAAALRLACVHSCRFGTRKHTEKLTGWAERQVGRLDCPGREAI